MMLVLLLMMLIIMLCDVGVYDVVADTIDGDVDDD